MKIKLFKAVVLLAVMTVYACSGVDIEDEPLVMNDIQGTWVGYEWTGKIYRHIKVNIKENKFDGWIQTSDLIEEPEWTILPAEMGNFSISSVLVNESVKYRSFRFSIAGACCGDNSYTAKTLSELITYTAKKGLSVGSVPMKRIQTKN